MIRPKGADRHELKFMPKRTICEQIGAGNDPVRKMGRIGMN